MFNATKRNIRRLCVITGALTLVYGILLLTAPISVPLGAITLIVR